MNREKSLRKLGEEFNELIKKFNKMEIEKAVEFIEDSGTHTVIHNDNIIDRCVEILEDRNYYLLEDAGQVLEYPALIEEVANHNQSYESKKLLIKRGYIVFDNEEELMNDRYTIGSVFDSIGEHEIVDDVLDTKDFILVKNLTDFVLENTEAILEELENQGVIKTKKFYEVV